MFNVNYMVLIMRATEELLKDAEAVKKVSFGYQGLQVISREHKQLIAELSAKLREREEALEEEYEGYDNSEYDYWVSDEQQIENPNDR